ncbi:hypothetical protein EUX98_g3885 [Antrodiella citrinella]|uniref:Transcription factor domain-containing protein n=1 Tax=Antrodiella citrinella TaxID=2447956 RepID=A0A4S4MWF2_9APHY|nr:hypothetical protein EUX98_g3885 [Antrodiella citrinella]
MYQASSGEYMLLLHLGTSNATDKHPVDYVLQEAFLTYVAGNLSSTVETLLARVSALEEALRDKRAQQSSYISPDSSVSGASPGSGVRSSPEFEARSERCTTGGAPGELRFLEKKDGPVALIDFDVQVAAVALAQLSLAPRTEYVGLGTVLCALHRLGDPDLCKLPYPHSTMMRARKRESDEHPIVSPIRCLLAQLPARNEVEDLLNIFFTTRNMEFGISEVWFRSAIQTMWYHMDRQCLPGCTSNGGCPSCQEEVNPHWLTLFFGVLAITPSEKENGSRLRAIFFTNAMAARRLIEDILLASPAAMSDSSLAGCVLSCLASAVLSVYLADHGRVSEAWKIVGGALRCGQAIGLHRDAQWRRWEKMGGVETELRTLTWWLLVVADRPVMSQRGTFETATLPAAQHGDGSPNLHVLYRKHMCKLSELISDATTKCLQWDTPTLQTISELHEQYQRWEGQLPARFKWRSASPKPIPDDDTPATPHRLLSYQRVLLASWWLDTLMGIYRIYLMEKTPANGTAEPGNPAREKCIALAMELTSVLLQFHDESSTWPARERMAPSFYQYFLFDGAVALAGALSQVPPHPHSSECLDLMNKAMRVLESVSRASEDSVDGEGETAKRGITVLKALVRAGGWEMGEREKGALVSLDEVQRRNRFFFASSPDVQNQHHQHSRLSSSPEFFSQSPPSQFYQPGFEDHQLSSGHASPLVPPSPPMSTSYGPTSTSFGGYGSSLPSMVMPYDILQGVQPTATAQSPSQSMNLVNFDIDWARLAGMDHWYSSSGGMAMGGQNETGVQVNAG